MAGKVIICDNNVSASANLPECLNLFDRKIVDNWCKTMLFNGITHSNNNVVNRKTIGLE